MASAARSLRLVSRSCRRQTALPNIGPKVFVAWKSVGGGGGVKESKLVMDDRQDRATPFDHWADQDAEEERRYRDMKTQQIAKSLMRDDAETELGASLGLDSILDKETSFEPDDAVAETHQQIIESTRPLRILKTPKRDAFWDDEEPDPDLVTNDDSDVFEENDMTDIAHAKLEEHREQRAYARTIVWEMPLLSKYATRFVPPTADQPLRFRYTSYMGELHPAEKKVVVEFSPQDFGLTPVQEMKLKKLARSRYNPEKDVIKMSCESFEHQAQNKRYLAELVEKLIAEAKDGKDTFEDIPLDLRHHPIKVKPKFPKEWRISSERMNEIGEYRDGTKQLEAVKRANGTLLDGAEIIKKALAARRLAPVLAATSGRPKKDGRRSLRF